MDPDGFWRDRFQLGCIPAKGPQSSGPGSPEGLRIEPVLGAPGGFLVADHLLQADDGDRLVPVGRGEAVLPGSLEADAIDGGDEVDPVRGKADLESARAAFSAANRSLKSGFTLMGLGPGQVFQGEVPQGFHPGLGRRAREGIHGRGVGLVEPCDSGPALSPALFGGHGMVIPAGGWIP